MRQPFSTIRALLGINIRIFVRRRSNSIRLLAHDIFEYRGKVYNAKWLEENSYLSVPDINLIGRVFTTEEVRILKFDHINEEYIWVLRDGHST